jgi:hypothetical protein
LSVSTRRAKAIPGRKSTVKKFGTSQTAKNAISPGKHFTELVLGMMDGKDRSTMAHGEQETGEEITKAEANLHRAHARLENAKADHEAELERIGRMVASGDVEPLA